MIGETLDGKYEITRKVGGGGMGSVYEARHKGTGRRVAVKVITGEYAKNQTLLTRFHREALASGSIETQHIVQVLDTGTDPATGLPFMVMEYLNGEDLAAVLQRLVILPPELALRMTAQACIGLQKAHDANVVHRDIKPGNLLLSERDDGELILKLLDFGIAKIKLDRIQQLESSGLTRTGHVLGSPLYMSPEQARGHKNIDHRTDIWSLGIMLYQMFAGRRPHEDIEALGELIIAICSDPPRPVQDFAPWLSPEMAAIVHGALHFDPAQRYQSASQMLDAIKPLLPTGWAITKDMLVPLSDEERAVVAPRLDGGMQGATQSSAHAVYRPLDPSTVGVGLDPTIAGAPLSQAAARSAAASAAAGQGAIAGNGALGSIPPPADSAAASAGRAAMSSYAQLPDAAAGSRPSMSGSIPGRAAPSEADLAGPPAGAQDPGARPATRLGLRAAAFLIASAVVAFVALRVLMPAPAEPRGAITPERTTPVPVATAPAVTAPIAMPSSAPTPAPAAAPAPSRKVMLVLVPSDVSAEVDGQPAQQRNGILEITGPIDSVHKVRLKRGAYETTGDVTVTAYGAEPPKLELVAKKEFTGAAPPRSAAPRPPSPASSGGP